MHRHPDPALVTAMYELLLNHTDERDMGDSAKSGPRHRRTNDTLIRNIHGGGRPDHLTNELIVKHLEGRATLYTKPRRGTDRVWVQLDVDAHHGEPDADAVAEYLEQLWPGLTYSEPSTNNRGVHVYLWLEPLQDLRRFNENLARYERWLSDLLHDLGYQATVEIKHTFTLLNRNRTEVTRRGQMAKAPRFANGLSDLQRFQALKAIAPAQLGASIEEANGGRARRGRAGQGGCGGAHAINLFHQPPFRFRSVEEPMPVSLLAKPDAQSMANTDFAYAFSNDFTGDESHDAFVRMTVTLDDVDLPPSATASRTPPRRAALNSL